MLALVPNNTNEVFPNACHIIYNDHDAVVSVADGTFKKYAFHYKWPFGPIPLSTVSLSSFQSSHAGCDSLLFYVQ